MPARPSSSSVAKKAHDAWTRTEQAVYEVTLEVQGEVSRGELRAAGNRLLELAIWFQAMTDGLVQAQGNAWQAVLSGLDGPADLGAKSKSKSSAMSPGWEVERSISQSGSLVTFLCASGLLSPMEPIFREAYVETLAMNVDPKGGFGDIAGQLSVALSQQDGPRLAALHAELPSLVRAAPVPLQWRSLLAVSLAVSDHTAGTHRNKSQLARALDTVTGVHNGLPTGTRSTPLGWSPTPPTENRGPRR